MLTVAKLKTRTVKYLASMAKRKGIAGWHSMRKEELIQALVRMAATNGNGHSKKSSQANGCQDASTSKAKKSGKGSNGHSSAPSSKARPPKVERRLDEIRNKLLEARDLSLNSASQNGHGDRLVAMVRDPYWLHVYWELSRQSVERARAALGQFWHSARPTLRLLELCRDGTTSHVRKLVRDIEIHGSVNNWYIDVDSPPRSFQLEIGYLGPGAKFVCLARSNTVTTPAVGPVRPNGAWATPDEDYDRIYALSGGYSEEGDHSELKVLLGDRLRRPLSSQFSVPTPASESSRRRFNFEVDAELVVFGVTEPDARVTLKGEPVTVDPDGTFRISFNLPERRQVFPVVASSSDGVEQRTIVLAVERNTKVMEPVIREPEA